jgi:tetratricopeptide (TPR) repeat protein
LATSGHGALGADPPPREVADRLLGEAQRLYLEVGQREDAAHCADIRAFYALQVGDVGAFDAYVRASLDLCPLADRHQDLPWAANKLRHLLLDLHAAAVWERSPADADEHLGRIVRRFPELQHVSQLATAHLYCADRWDWKYDCGFLEGREMHLAVARGLYEQTGDEAGLVEVAFESALLADRLVVSVALADPEDTSFRPPARVDDVHKVRDVVSDREQTLRDCRAYYRAHGHFDKAADCSRQLGAWARERGDGDTARGEFRQALGDYQASPDWPASESGVRLWSSSVAGDSLLRSVAICQNALGELALADGDTDEARNWFEAAGRNAQGRLARDIRARIEKNSREL